MTNQHPLTPPPGLVHKWALEAEDEHQPTVAYSLVGQIATKAARWGADQQLTEDAKWLDHNALNESHLRIIPVGKSLREAMRPKPPSLKEQALEALGRFSANSHTTAHQMQNDFDLFRRALEALDD